MLAKRFWGKGSENEMNEMSARLGGPREKEEVEGVSHVETRLQSLGLLHSGLLEIHLRVPGLKHETESKLTRSELLESLL